MAGKKVGEGGEDGGAQNGADVATMVNKLTSTWAKIRLGSLEAAAQKVELLQTAASAVYGDSSGGSFLVASDVVIALQKELSAELTSLDAQEEVCRRAILS